MPGTARVTDKTIGICSCHDDAIEVEGVIETGSPTRFVNGLAVARKGDIVRADCGHTGIISTYSPDVFVDGLPVARLGDKTEGCYVATIITSSEDTITNT